jgi:hypothetical protein
MQLLFGFKDHPIEALKSAVSIALGITLELHDSLWRGGDYYGYEHGAESIFLERNNDGGQPEEPAEEDFPDYPVLLYVETEQGGNGASRTAAVQPSPNASA